ncbi:MAG: DUF4160 domain-containing protein [Polyangiaceae bacterium]
MPRIGEALGILFYVYAEDHNPPHVHAIYGAEQAQLVIASGALLAGSLPGNKLRQAQDWLAANRAVAQAAWDRLNP